MKDIQGIMIAAALAVVGAGCAWFYLAQQGQTYQKEAFVIIADGARINAGDKLVEDDFAKLEIPKPAVGSISKVAVTWDLKSSLVGRIATRSYDDGELVIEKELRTVGQKDFSKLLAKDQVARSITVDNRNFVPERVNPGNLVSFEVPTTGKPSGSSKGPITTEVFGPFEVLALGARTGSLATQKAAGQSSGSQHVITIGVKFPLTADVSRLFEMLRMSRGSGVQVLIHSDDYEAEAP